MVPRLVSNFDLIADLDTHFLGVFGIDLDKGFGEGPLQLRDLHGHGARVPVIQDPTGGQNKGIFAVRLLRRSLIGRNQITALPSGLP